MSAFIERNPKEKAVEEAFRELAENGYVASKPDPADNVFEIAEKLRKRAQRSRQDYQSTKPQSVLPTTLPSDP